MILIDLLSTYPTAFFLNILNSKNFIKIIFYGLIIDFFISYTNGLITLFLLIGYLLKKVIKNYYLFNIIVFIFFYLIFIKSYFIDSFSLQLIFIILNKNHIVKW